MSSHSKKSSRTGGKRGGQGSDVLARQRELYALPLGEFMRARNALAAELKAQGQAKQAQETRQLRRPVIPAWVVNQLVHHAPEKLQRLQEAARALEKEHRRALSGLGAEQLKEATRAFQQALDPLMREASATLSAAGRASSVELLRQIEETLRAGTLGTEEERAPLAQGMLTQPLQQSGFGALSPLLLVGPSPEARARVKARAPKPKPRPTPPLAPPAPTPPAREGVVLRGPWPTRPSKRQEQATRAEQKRAQRAAEQEQRRQAEEQRAREAKDRRQREAELTQLRREARQRAQDAEARRKREAELARLRREARQRLAQAERAERGASLELTREEAMLKAAQAKTQRMREAFEQAQAAEQERTEAVSRVRTRAEAAAQAVEQARGELQELDARLFR